MLQLQIKSDTYDIKILWRFMKYEWIELNADKTLVSYVEKVLRDFGANYVINFA